MIWNVENTDEFTEWWNELTNAQQEDITATAELLMEHGPNLPFPAFLGHRKFQTRSYAGITGAKRRSPDPDFLRIRPETLGRSC